MRPRWHEGIWLGKLWRSDEHILASGEGVRRAATIRALPPSESWSLAAVEAIRATPWNFNPKPETPVRVIPVDENQQESPDTTRPMMSRGFRVEKRDLRDFGYTAGCRKCTMTRMGDRSQPTLGHDGQCRQRIAEELRKGTEAQRRRVERSDAKANEFAARKLEEECSQKQRGGEEHKNEEKRGAEE